MTPEHRYLLDIEPKRGDETVRMPKRDSKGWWN
jgi:hypothetical protein